MFKVLRKKDRAEREIYSGMMLVSRAGKVIVKIVAMNSVIFARLRDCYRRSSMVSTPVVQPWT